MAGRRAPRGARGLKQNRVKLPAVLRRRAPRGARGLKRVQLDIAEKLVGRAPRGARGLKLMRRTQTFAERWSRPARGAWIETRSAQHQPWYRRSRPARGAWIETLVAGRRRERIRVAPRAGRVD